MDEGVIKAFNDELRTINQILHEHGTDLKQIKTGLELLNKIAERLETAITTLNVEGCARACPPNPPDEITPLAIPRRRLRGTSGRT